ncbi:MAG: tetratricopeptide repeat protein, partial [Chloroflexi bacterium]|nr:tetratricopeptide repeat protein [Chloroflexota bacterium]
IEDLNQAIGLDPLQINAHNNLGLAYAGLGDYQRQRIRQPGRGLLRAGAA